MNWFSQDFLQHALKDDMKETKSTTYKLKLRKTGFFMSDDSNNGQNEAKVWREWILTSENLVHKVEGPVYSSSDIIKVIEIGALDELKAENDRLTKELETVNRANIIAERRLYGDSSDMMDASQEAAHYNWLEEQNENLTEELELQKLKANSRNEYVASLEQEAQRLKSSASTVVLKHQVKQLREKLRVAVESGNKMKEEMLQNFCGCTYDEQCTAHFVADNYSAHLAKLESDNG